VGHAVTGQPGNDTAALPADLIFALASRPTTNTATFLTQPLTFLGNNPVRWSQNSQGDLGSVKAFADGLVGDHSPIFAGHQEKVDAALALFFDFAGTDQEDATSAE